MANLREIKGNIFESNCQTIVNTVNCFGVMGKGLALEFKLRYPEMYINYKEVCDNKLLKTGTLQLWKNNSPWILNFPTKNHWKNPSKLEYIESGLKKFSEFYSIKGIKSIAFPQLGTQAGGLNWNDVKSLMFKYLEPLPELEIEIYSFNKNAKDSMFDSLIDIIGSYTEKKYKTKLQIPKNKSQILIEAFSNKSVNSMLGLQKLPGIGEKTLIKFYDLLKEKDFNNKASEQMTLF